MAFEGHRFHLTLSRDEPASLGEALLAGLPHLLYPWAIFGRVYLSSLFYRRQVGTSSLAMDLAFWALVLVGLGCAWRRSWPRWSATWIGYGLVMALELLWVLTTTGGSADPIIAILVGIFWLVLMVAFLDRIARRDWLDGLLAVLPIVPMWISVLALELIIGDEASIFLVDGLVMSLFVILIVRRGKLLTGMGLMLAAITWVGLPIAYARVYHTGFIPSSAPSQRPDSLGVLVGYLTYLVAFFIAAAPVWLVGLWKWFRQRGIT